MQRQKNIILRRQLLSAITIYRCLCTLCPKNGVHLNKVPFSILSSCDPGKFADRFVYSGTAIWLDPAVLSGRCPAEDHINALTVQAAEAAGEADLLGAIEKGKYADLVVYDKDPRSMSSDELMSAKPYMAVINGKIISSSMMEVAK